MRVGESGMAENGSVFPNNADGSKWNVPDNSWSSACCVALNALGFAVGAGNGGSARDSSSIAGMSP